MSRDERHPIELIAEEFLARYRDGEDPTIEEYAERHPDLAADIQELLPTVLAMEGWKRHRVTAATGSKLPVVDPPEKLGDYRIVREIGKGGMGVVFEAEQETLDRRVAIKVLPPAARLDTRLLNRFEREARTAARLVHANIVPVLGVGEQDGLHYYVMQLIDGIGLDHALERLADDTPREKSDFDDVIDTLGAKSTRAQTVARIGIDVADAIQFAHARGVRHRDIKPANLLIDDTGSVWVTDFGIARALDEMGENQRVTDISGTMQYMAPEQWDGHDDERSDVYSLGLTLYELLLLRRAHVETHAQRLHEKIKNERPAAPRSVDPDVPRDLDAIVRKAIELDPKDRYQSAEALAADLRRFGKGLPVDARSISSIERTWRWARRNRAVAALVAGVIAAVLAAVVVGWFGFIATRAALARESEKKREAIEATGRAESNLTLSLTAFDDIIDRIAGRDPLEPADLAVEGETDWFASPAISERDGELLETILEFYDRFALENKDSDTLALETGRAYRRAGDIHRQLGQTADARAAYERALELLAENGGDALAAATLQNAIGRVHAQTGAIRNARKAHEKALEILTKSPESAPRYRYELARTQNFLGMSLHRSSRRRRRRRESPVPHYTEARDIADALLAKEPKNTEYRLLKAQSLRLLGEVKMRREKETAFAHQAEAIAILDDLLTELPSSPVFRYELMLTYAAVNTRSESVEDIDRRIDCMESAKRIGEALVADNSAILEYRMTAGRILLGLGRLQEQVDNSSEAETSYRQALELMRQVTQRHPSLMSAWFTVSGARHHLIDLLSDQDRPLEATAMIEEWIAETRDRIAQDPERNRSYHFLTGELYLRLARVLDDLEQDELALEARRQSELELKKAPRWRSDRGDRPRRRVPGRPPRREN